jgi:hypothetical protein
VPAGRGSQASRLNGVLRISGAMSDIKKESHRGAGFWLSLFWLVSCRFKGAEKAPPNRPQSAPFSTPFRLHFDCFSPPFHPHFASRFVEAFRPSGEFAFENWGFRRDRSLWGWGDFLLFNLQRALIGLYQRGGGLDRVMLGQFRNFEFRSKCHCSLSSLWRSLAGNSRRREIALLNSACDHGSAD